MLRCCVLFCVFSVAVCSIARSAAQEHTQIQAISPPMPIAELAMLEGEYTLVNVWASWCIPCVAELPIFENIQLQHHNWNIVFVNIDSDQALAQSFLTTHGLEWVAPLTLYDKKLSIMRQLKLKSIPSTFGYRAKKGAFALFEGEIKKGELENILHEMEAIGEKQ